MPLTSAQTSAVTCARTSAWRRIARPPDRAGALADADPVEEPARLQALLRQQRAAGASRVAEESPRALLNLFNPERRPVPRHQA